MSTHNIGFYGQICILCSVLEILGALVSILFLWVVTGVLVYMGVERCVNQDFEVEATIMLITAACGVAFNVV